MSAPFGVTVTLVHPVARDRFGDPVAGSPSTSTVTGVVVWPRGSTEQNDGRSVVATGLDMLFPPGSPIPAARDKVQLDGKDYQVDGEPFAWRSELTGTDAGVQVSVTRVTG